MSSREHLYQCLQTSVPRHTAVSLSSRSVVPDSLQPHHEELDMTERLHFPFSFSCIGEGNGNPLQCSCLENPRDRGAWWRRIDAFELWHWRRLLRVPWTARRSNQSILKEISPGCLEGLMLKLKLQYFGLPVLLLHHLGSSPLIIF